MIVGVIVLVAVAALAGRAIVSSPSRPAPAAKAPSAAGNAIPDGVRFRDARTGIAITYPRSWTRVPSSDRGVKLLVAGGRAASLLVREIPVGLVVTPDTLPIVRQLTDNLVRADRRVKLLEQPRPVMLGGLPGYRYRYTFATSGGGRGAHDHYFLFTGGQMVTLVFQALPAQRLAQTSQLFERLAATFRIGVR